MNTTLAGLLLGVLLLAMVPAVSYGEKTHSVSIIKGALQATNNAYSPNPTNIEIGDTVVWVNNDNVLHTVTSGSYDDEYETRGSDFSSGYIAPQSSYELTFEDTGSFDYFCLLHPYMVGTVNVGEIIEEEDPPVEEIPEPAPSEQVPEEPEPVADPDVELFAVSIVRAHATAITVADTGLDVYEFQIQVDGDVKGVKAPAGWDGFILDQGLVVFTTDENPLTDGEKLPFRLYTPEPVKSVNWTAFDADLDVLDEGSLEARVR